jgi:hypothetical protein
MDGPSLIGRLLFAPVIPFVGHPERIMAVVAIWILAAALSSVWRKKTVWAPWFAGIVWALFAAWEWHCVRMGYNIRVDLFLVSPLLLAFTVFGIVGLFVTDPQQFSIRRRFSVRELLILMTCMALALGAVMWFIRR